MLWYDKQALEAAGITEDPAELAANDEWTTDKFLEMIDALDAADKLGAIFWNYWATHWSWVTANDGQVYDEDGNFVLPDDPNSIAALEELAKRFQAGSVRVWLTPCPSPGPIPRSSTTTPASSRRVDTPSAWSRIAGVRATATTSCAGPRRRRARPTGVAAAYLGINKGTDNADAAWDFYEEFLSADGQRFRLSGGGNAVPSIKGADDIVLEGYPASAQEFISVRDLGYANFPSEARVPGLSGDISTAMQEMYEGRASVDETVAAISDLIAQSE